jgi:mono/diheme cytochrome c family protein
MSEAGAVKTWILAFVVLVVVGFGTLVGVGCVVGANQCLFTKHKPQTSTDGQTLYAANCIACHGIRGEGGQGDAPPLRSGDATTLSVAEIEKKIANGKPFFMPAYSTRKHGPLNDAQIAALAQYVITLRSNP